MSELTDNGIVPRRKADIVSDFRARVRQRFGDDFDVSDNSDLVRAFDPLFVELDTLYQLGDQLADSFDERSATGYTLEAIARLTGTLRQAGTRSVGTLTLTGNALTVVPAGYLVANATTGALFRTTSDVTIPDTGAAAGTETVDVSIESSEIGAVTAAAGSLTEPVTLLSGVVSVTNAAAVTPGTAADTDPQLRVRRRNELQSAGNGTPGALYAAVTNSNNVQAAVVINNNTDAVDANGVPARSIRVVVFPTLTDDDDKLAVARAIAEQETAGEGFDGDQTFTVAKADGQTTAIAYAFATEVDTRYKVTVVSKAGYPANGDDLVKDQVLKYFGLVAIGDGEDIIRWQVGQNVELVQMLCNIVETVPGIQSLTLLGDYVAVDPPLLTTIVPIGATEVAVIGDASQVEVTST